MSGLDLGDRLAELTIPGEAAARERARRAVEDAFAARRRTPRALPRRLTPVTVALAVLAFAASALASTGAGGTVTRWVRDLVDPPPARPLGELPSPGRLLVTGAAGTWLIEADGRRRHLGPFGDATWSPHGLFVAGVDGRRLLTVTPDGDERWSLRATAAIRAVRWSPDGYRIAYATADGMRVVAGDGSGDRIVGARSRIAPAWRPDRSHTLAFVTSAGALVVSRVDRGTFATLGRDLGAATWVGWAGRRLILVATPRTVVAMSPGATTVRRWTAPPGSTIAAAEASPSGTRTALLLRSAATSRIVLLDPRAMRVTRTLLSVRGTMRDLVWSPDGRWLVTALPRRGRWLLAPATAGGQPHTLTGLGAAFGAPAARARPRGWCCAADR